LRETVFDSLVDSLRQVDPDATAADPAAQLHKVVARAAESRQHSDVDAASSSSPREPPRLSARLAAIAAMRDTLCEGLWALHEERPAEPLPFLAAKLQAQSQAQQDSLKPS
jgi:hypothetical protein